VTDSLSRRPFEHAIVLVTLTTIDVSLLLRESAQGLVGTCVYKPHLFGARTIDRLLRDFEQVLEYMVMQPEGRISAIPVSLDERLSRVRA